MDRNLPFNLPPLILEEDNFEGMEDFIMQIFPEEEFKEAPQNPRPIIRSQQAMRLLRNNVVEID